MTSTNSLVAELTAERERMLAALSAIDPASLATPGLIGEWSATELVAHLGYWAGHAAEIIHEVQEGRADEAGVGEPPVDDVNETVARVARQTAPASVRKREAASFDALVERLSTMDPALLSAELPSGSTLEALVREDGPEHYREHAEELEAITQARPNG